MAGKRWAGRFAHDMDQQVEQFTSSVDVDRELWREDLDASVAHARMLGRQGIIPEADSAAIIEGLGAIAAEIESGDFEWRDDLEDVHGNIEDRLAQLIGVAAAGRLHTGRSRNDQVATDLRLWLKRRLPDVDSEIQRLQGALLDQAEALGDASIPGYTHLQRAQPVLIAHHLLAYFEMLDRDRSRFSAALDRLDELPLGSGALAGVPYPINREMVAAELGFSRVTANSMDAVADRDFVVDVQAAAATCMMHLSRLAEGVIIWASAEFGLIEIADSHATGSSIMPHKKNPDVAELIRGRTGRVYGNLLAILTTLKGLPLTYNRDLQEDKGPLFESLHVLFSCLEAMTGLIGTSHFQPQPMVGSAAVATDYADYLVKKGMPFSEAHAAVGRLVRQAEDENRSISDLSLEDLKAASELFAEDALALDVASVLAARDVEGGTAPKRVAAAIKNARSRMEKR